MTSLQWVLAALSIAGVVLNIGKHRHCFLLWLVTSASWCVLDFQHGLPGQGIVQACYFCLSAWGWWRWKRDESHTDTVPG